MKAENIEKSKSLLFKLRGFESKRSVIAYLKKINNYLMEELVLSSLEAQGHAVKRNHRYSGDGGIDGKAVIYGKQFYIQTKRYTGHISKQHMAAFIAICDRDRVNGLFVHTGKTGRYTKNLSRKSKRVTIVSGGNLYRMIKGKTFGVKKPFLFDFIRALKAVLYK